MFVSNSPSSQKHTKNNPIVLHINVFTEPIAVILYEEVRVEIQTIKTQVCILLKKWTFHHIDGELHWAHQCNISSCGLFRNVYRNIVRISKMAPEEFYLGDSASILNHLLDMLDLQVEDIYIKRKTTRERICVLQEKDNVFYKRKMMYSTRGR